jgi:hypothetical protein
LGYAGPVTKAPARTPGREWRLWLDVHGTGWTVNDANTDLKGSQVNLTAGLTRMLTPDMLVGGDRGL